MDTMMINKKLPNTFKIYTLFFYFFALPLFGSEDPRSHPKYTDLKIFYREIIILPLYQ